MNQCKISVHSSEPVALEFSREDREVLKGAFYMYCKLSRNRPLWVRFDEITPKRLILLLERSPQHIIHKSIQREVACKNLFLKTLYLRKNLYRFGLVSYSKCHISLLVYRYLPVVMVCIFSLQSAFPATVCTLLKVTLLLCIFVTSVFSRRVVLFRYFIFRIAFTDRGI